ncbi:MAG: helix-turn-helix domain-containing protein [Methylotenera sp.]|uniref:helix-turn-helix domain-containing protein n=1 Tax=Methylotenera sp. TaxID=2051956 RepID=UPI002725E819|nr:helix-turn-helix domain-containing protein [Methylotenera sp.]MDO9151678.1 helix-turn-helix domain-containing protein [Methylotenera sp.]
MANNENTQNKGVAVDATTPKAKNIKPKFTDNSLRNQRLKLLDYLREHGSITTSQARELLDIYYPPARAFELKKEGYLITTIWDSWVSEYGIKHRIGRYVLTQKQPIESEA